MKGQGKLNRATLTGSSVHHPAGHQKLGRDTCQCCTQDDTLSTKPLLLCVQVNRKLAAQAMLDARKREAEDLEGEPSAKKRKPSGPSVLEDPRFQALFEDPSFAVDEEADEYKTLHPNAGRHWGALVTPGHRSGSHPLAEACQLEAGQGAKVAGGEARHSGWRCLWREYPALQ